MSLLERLKRKQEELRASSSCRNKCARIEEHNSSTEVDSSCSALLPRRSLQQKTTLRENSSSNQEAEDPDWIEAKAPKKIEFIPNEVSRRVDLNRLVWAFYYNWNTIVPARLCDNQEALSEPTITTWPIPSDKVVVEPFGQVKEKGHTRLLLVERNKIFPFWAQSVDCEESDYDCCDAWNNYRVNYLKKKVCVRWIHANTNYMKIMTVCWNV